MKTINDRLRETNRFFVQKIKEGDTNWYLPDHLSNSGNDNFQGIDIMPLTASDRIFKSRNIHVCFTDTNVAATRLSMLVFINGELKYRAYPGSFIIKHVTYPVIKRSGWKIYTEMVTEPMLMFKTRKGADNFDLFCSKLKCGPKIHENFRACCKEYCASKPSKEVAKIQDTILE